MREIRTYGSEGGEGRKPFPTPITSCSRDRGGECRSAYSAAPRDHFSLKLVDARPKAWHDDGASGPAMTTEHQARR